MTYTRKIRGFIVTKRGVRAYFGVVAAFLLCALGEFSAADAFRGARLGEDCEVIARNEASLSAIKEEGPLGSLTYSFIYKGFKAKVNYRCSETNLLNRQVVIFDVDERDNAIKILDVLYSELVEHFGNPARDFRNIDWFTRVKSRVRDLLTGDPGESAYGEIVWKSKNGTITLGILPGVSRKLFVCASQL